MSKAPGEQAITAEEGSLRIKSIGGFLNHRTDAAILANDLLPAVGLPAAWAHLPCWTILETGFGTGHGFLATWRAWQTDPARPRVLHFVATDGAAPQRDRISQTAALHPDWLPLAEQLNTQLWGLLPGTHRLVFAGGQVLLTLLIGHARTLLRSQRFAADSIFLNLRNAAPDSDPPDTRFAKTLARCCKRGTRVVSRGVTNNLRSSLMQCGFVMDDALAPAGLQSLRAVYDPAWPVHRAAAAQAHAVTPARCVVVGAGLAGAAVAASLARRGWAVQVLDAADTPASGASSLPAGVLAPHVSPDDSLLSQLSRSGVRATLQQAAACLQSGRDWQLSGVLERSLGVTPRRPPADWQVDWQAGAQSPGSPADNAVREWLQPASSAQLAAGSLPFGTPALWHGPAGWIKPAALVHAWLATPGVQFCAGANVARLQRKGECWDALDANGSTLATAELIVLAAGLGSRLLAETAASSGDTRAGGAASATLAPLALQAIRGQVSWCVHSDVPAPTWPDFPINGAGSVIASIPCGTGTDTGTGSAEKRLSLWGATYQRNESDLAPRTADAATNAAQLRELAPALASAIESARESSLEAARMPSLAAPTADAAWATTQNAMGATGAQDVIATPQVMGAWTGVRCATPTRLPMLGPLRVAADDGAANLWVCTGMGSRGLTYAALCAEVLAARLHGEPAPVDDRLAASLTPRFNTGLAAQIQLFTGKK